MDEERLTLADLGFEFGPDPLGNEALLARADEFFHRPGVIQAGLVFAAVAVYVLWTKVRAAKERRDAVIIVEGRRAQASLQRLQAFAELRGRDPGFDEKAFLERASAIFLKVQGAWSARSLGLARPFVSDGFLERLREEHAIQDAAGVRHRLSEVELRDALAIDFACGVHYDCVAVRFKVSARRESVDAKTGAVREGGHETYEEIWTFARRLGAATKADRGALEGRCPSCGAALVVSDAARCGACKAWINSGEFDWIAVKSTVPWEWRFPDPRREVTGWSALREKDPEVGLTVLEDRATVAFWRLLAAWRAKDGAGLRGLAAPEFIAGLRFDEVLFEPQIGAVETAAFVPGPDVDEVHIQVRWEANRRRRTDYMIFQRRAGVETRWKAGLSATRCQACGAPIEGVAQAVCGYCGEPVGWVLARVEAFGEWRRPGDDGQAQVLPGAEFGAGAPPVDVLAALAVLAVSDRAISDRERAYLSAVADRLGVPQEKVDELIESARTGGLEFNPGFDVGMLRGLVRAALVDGFVEGGERTLLARSALRSGVHELELQEIIREERAAMAAKARDLLKRLR